MGYKEPDDQIEGHKSEIFIFSGNIMKELEINEANNMFLTCFPYSTKRKKTETVSFFRVFLQYSTFIMFGINIKGKNHINPNFHIHFQN